jgi:hypothetical protein
MCRLYWGMIENFHVLFNFWCALGKLAFFF